MVFAINAIGAYAAFSHDPNRAFSALNAGIEFLSDVFCDKTVRISSSAGSLFGLAGGLP
jgi:hypothetical protein